ncbi:MAG TPA: TonB-dependent receptor [Steroidobacteraceae bacterium]|nr:TonB-dependent receptor [Steroidobacteraceae bacterium]
MNRHANGSAARALLAGAVVLAALCLAHVSRAEEEDTRQYPIDIAQLPLTEALQVFAQQTGLQCGYSPTDDAEEQLMVGPIEGRLTVREILTQLLPKGFTFQWVNSRTVAILSPSANEPPGGIKAEVAAKDQQHSELSKGQQLSLENGGGKSGSARGPYDFKLSMIVRGKRIGDSVFDSLDLDIPAQVFDREDIDRSGASTVTDLFRLVTQQPNLKPGSFLGDGTQFADLRGLGFDTTLVLINGRRTTPTASALSVNAFDLNSVPLGVVEGVEIVSDSSSAIYGADAIGGVINIMLRDEIPEPRLDIDYGAADGGAVERHAAFGASGSYRRARGSIVLDYFDRSPLLGRERDRWNNQDFTRFGGRDWRSPAASPGNVSSATLENLPGLPATFAAIPGTSPGTVLLPADFLATAGHQNLESLLRYQSITDAGTRKGASARGEYALAQRLAAYAELLYVEGEIQDQFEPPALSGAQVGGANPYNPFGTDVLVDTLLTDLGPRTFTRRTEMIQSTAGLRGRIGEWEWEAFLQKGQNDASTVRTGELDLIRVSAALLAADAGDALNPFGGAGANSPTLLTSLLAPPSQSRFRTESIQSVASIGGALAELPAGALQLNAGVERREERVRYDMAPPLNVAGSHERSIVAAYGELRLPVVGEAAQVPAVHDLALVLSGRVDDYSDVGRTFNPEYALIWRPTSALTMRTSVSQGFRPPPLFDLHMPLVDAQGFIVDPARNGEFAIPIVRAGGNPDLKPSNANSLNIGMQFAARGMRALRLGANYWQIDIDQTIGIPAATRLLAAEDSFPDRVVRGPASAADIAAGIPGPLQLVDVRRLNFGTIQTSGVDLNASFTLDTRAGKFKPELSATWIHDYTTSNLVEGLNVSRVGVANFQGTIPRWRAVATLDWSHQGFGLTSTVRYVPSYDDVDFLGIRTRRTVDSETVVDAQFSVDLGEALGGQSPWNGCEIRAGVFNLFDTEPPFAEVAFFAGYDSTESDLRQRFAYVKIAKKF